MNVSTSELVRVSAVTLPDQGTLDSFKRRLRTTDDMAQ